MLSALRFSHELLKETVGKGDSVVDATVGNGNDTVLLASLVEKTGTVYGFDIQQQAIDNTRQKLILTGLTPQVKLFHQGHETISDVVEESTELSAAIFNLGYLPKSDKSIVTKPDTTLKAFDAVLPRLRIGGKLIVVVYYGHEGGDAEKDAVLHYMKNLPQEDYDVLQYGFINKTNAPPFLLAVEKKKQN
ncbi:class I SAM-dependent methyltransferase [Atopococcus tabaci]|uniref:class I SAM-dependent methyltransferase n=1 Tax=Atopococcus tabaci TaxID=269774 RepID=UPI00240A7FF8|nr:class I SAM-dependent methyltransferase [Atopococcus tabaci]